MNFTFTGRVWWVRAGIAGGLPTHNLEQLRAAWPELVIPNYSYMTCAEVCWKNIGELAEENHHPERVASVFEEGTEGKGLLFGVHADILTNHPETAAKWHLGPLGFDFKKKMRPLQAADFFAYESYKRLNETLTDQMRWRKSIGLILPSVPVYATYLGDKRVAEVIQDWKDRGLGQK